MGTLYPYMQTGYINSTNCEEVLKETIKDNEPNQVRQVLLEEILSATQIL